MSGVTLSEDGIVTGNTYDKYGSSNPLVRRMMSGFGGRIALKAGEAAVRSAVGVHHQDHSAGAMQPNRFVDLVENELAVKILIG